jgi:ArsR family transcriptional regulator, lead/cadmium/zinc/bismuth-responsive transcriptional repressor
MTTVRNRRTSKAKEVTCDAYNDDPKRVGRVFDKMPSDRAFGQMALALRAMADPARARILYALTIEPLCVCEFSRLLEMSMPAVSHHLRILTLSGLVTVRKEGKFACYHLHDERLTGTLRALVKGLADFDKDREDE